MGVIVDQRINALTEEIRKFVGKQLTSVSCGPLTHELAKARGEVLMGGEQEFVALHFSDGSTLKIESRSGWKDEGGFLVVR